MKMEMGNKADAVMAGKIGKAGNTRGGGQSMMKDGKPNGDAMTSPKNPDKYMAYKGNGGAANGKNVGKGC